ncbi:hypothetical protein VNI00_011320 [Paramarasmius palmivorus]|uniref:HNH nuclease domain-containing protein n=1 Tax=Paramarasmius palmivorus TaxID=297713 RepID=A0AAW0CFQ9_9AGAR
MPPLPTFELPLPSNGLPHGYGWDRRDFSEKSTTTAFNTGLHQRDQFLGERRCTKPTTWTDLKGRIEHEPRNALIMCSNHHLAFDAYDYLIRFVPEINKFVFVNYSGHPALQQFHCKAIALDINDRYAPFPSLLRVRIYPESFFVGVSLPYPFIIHEMRVRGFHPFRPISPDMPDDVPWQDWIVSGGVFDDASGSFKRVKQTSGTTPPSQLQQGTSATNTAPSTTRTLGLDANVDTLRQILEGLTLLHENGVVHGGFSSRDEGVPLIMLDPSADPHSDSSEVVLNRTRYPVRYYFTNLEKAQIVLPRSPGLGALYSTTSPASSPTKTPAQEAFRDDLASLGHFLHALLDKSCIPVSPLRKKLVSLTRSMQQGTLRTADEARRLFEVLVGSVDGELLAASVEVEVVGLGDGEIVGTGTRERKQSIVVDLGQDTDSDLDTMRKERKEKLKPRKPSSPFGSLNIMPPPIVSSILPTRTKTTPISNSHSHNSDSDSQDEDEKTLFDGNSDDSSTSSSLYKEKRPWVFRSLSEGTHRRHGKGRHRLMPSLDVHVDVGVSVGVSGVEGAEGTSIEGCE